MKNEINVIANPTEMTIHRPGAATQRAPEGISNGPFLFETLLDSNRDGEMTAIRAVYNAGIVTHWHTHRLGQFLYVLSGLGLVQHDGGPVEEVRAGDCVWFAPGEKHWYGAAPTGPFSCVSIQVVKDGRATDWLEPVAR